MSTITLDEATSPAVLHVRPTRVEKIFGLLRDLDVPLTAVTDVESLPRSLSGARGLRAPGTGIPAVLALGTWRAPHRKSFVLARRGVPGLRMRLAGQRYDEVVVATPDADALAARLRRLLDRR